MEDYEDYFEDDHEDENIAPLKDYEKTISKEIKENPDFDVWVEIEIVTAIRDAHYVLHEYDKGEDQSKKLEMLRWKALFMTVIDN